MPAILTVLPSTTTDADAPLGNVSVVLIALAASAICFGILLLFEEAGLEIEDVLKATWEAAEGDVGEFISIRERIGCQNNYDENELLYQDLLRLCDLRCISLQHRRKIFCINISAGQYYTDGFAMHSIFLTQKGRQRSSASTLGVRPVRRLD